MARTHMHRLLAARDTCPTSSGSNAAILVYLDTLFKTLSVSPSLSKVTSWSRKLGSPSCFFASAHVGSLLRRIITPSSTICTAGGGLAYAFTSAMSFLLRSSSAFWAASSAGRALSKSACASSAMALHSISSLEIFSDSMFTCFCCSSTTRFSCTMTTSISSHSVCALATTFFFCSNSTDISPTCAAVSLSFCSPFLSLLACSPTLFRFSPSSLQ
mmetsp:Transcript_29039/g.63581  ORF Transcript_29039/g.63581 Transcript_29039/m.63581 type:complete len:215 (-) Transcript_29039:1484-2128(-)